MNILDILIIFGYLAAMLAIGMYANKKQKNLEDYYVASKSIGASTVMCLWVSYWVGGATMLGTVQQTYDFGISGGTYPIIVALGLLIFGVTFAGMLNKLGTRLKYITLPDLIRDRYDERSGIVSAITMIVIYVAYTAAQLVACASIIHVLSGWSLGLCYIVSTAVVVIYTSIGGFLAVTYTDWVQLGILIVGIFVIALPVAMSRAGGLAAINTTVPPEFFSLRNSSISGIVAMFISTVLCFYTNMDSFTRCFAAKSPRDARNGTIWAAVLVFIIGLLTMLLGFCAKVILPGLEDSSNALGLLVFDMFPGGMRALVLMGVLSAAMSSGDICILTASANLTNDIYKKYLNKDASDKHLVRVGILASLFVGGLSALLAWFIPNVIDVLFIGINVASATLFFPIIGGLFWKKANKTAAFWSTLVTLVVVCLWSIANKVGAGGIFALDSVYPGLLCSGILFFSISILKPADKTEQKRIDSFLSMIKTDAEEK
ncbi:MAG: sodium:solute symporter family protein [Oscillospiraceae bacterium]